MFLLIGQLSSIGPILCNGSLVPPAEPAEDVTRHMLSVARVRGDLGEVMSTVDHDAGIGTIPIVNAVVMSSEVVGVGFKDLL